MHKCSIRESQVLSPLTSTGCAGRIINYKVPTVKFNCHAERLLLFTLLSRYLCMYVRKTIKIKLDFYKCCHICAKCLGHYLYDAPTIAYGGLNRKEVGTHKILQIRIRPGELTFLTKARCYISLFMIVLLLFEYFCFLSEIS